MEWEAESGVIGALVRGAVLGGKADGHAGRAGDTPARGASQGEGKGGPHPNGAACNGMMDAQKCGACCHSCCADGPMGMSANELNTNTGCRCMKRW